MKSSQSIARLSMRILATFGIVIGLSGCESLAITALGIGASAGVTHKVDSVGSRTFTATTKKVRSASLAALGRMGIKVETTDKTETGEIIKASTADCAIEIEIEAISGSATRMKAVAKRGFFVYDAATAKEIIVQTERVLGKV